MKNPIDVTRKWIEAVVVGCNFCPFAAKELKAGTVRYTVQESEDWKVLQEAFLAECEWLDEHPETETSLLILTKAVRDFEDYLDLAEVAEQLLEANDYEGVYQVASFHPKYRFEDSAPGDPANYTNRSPYPMLHLLREASVEAALERYPDPDSIPERNIEFAREKGLGFMRSLRQSASSSVVSEASASEA